MRPDRVQLGRVALTVALAASVIACASGSGSPISVPPSGATGSALISASPAAEATADPSAAGSPAGSVPAGYLDPSIDDWIASARLPHACAFPVAGAFEAVFERVDIRVEEMTAPYTVAGSVCRFYYSSSDLWFGNLHAFPPVVSVEDLRAAALDLRGGTWSAGTYEGRDYLHSHDSLLLAHDRATLWVISAGMASPFEDIDGLAAAIFEAMDASVVE